MIRQPLAIALAVALLPFTASATDLLQTYELARAGDAQFSAAEANRLANREGAVQARAAMLPQISGDATLRRSRSTGPTISTQFDPATGEQVQFSGDIETETTSRNLGVNVNQIVFDRARFTTLRS